MRKGPPDHKPRWSESTHISTHIDSHNRRYVKQANSSALTLRLVWQPSSAQSAILLAVRPGSRAYGCARIRAKARKMADFTANSANHPTSALEPVDKRQPC